MRKPSPSWPNTLPETSAAKPLAGLRVVEFAGIGPAPFAAMLLADMGAQIVRIDRPGGADPWTRKVIQRGRLQTTADLKNPDDLAAVTALITRADVLIEGFRPGVMERLGLGPQAMHALNPALIYARMTGWGQSGPLAQRAGHDITYIAISGALAAIGPKAHPVPPLNLVGDMGGGALYLVNGILAALLAVRAGAGGSVIDCAISDGAASLMAMFSDLAEQGRWNTRERASNLLDGGAPFYTCYACSDGKFVAVGALEPQFFAQLCNGLGVPVIPEDERLSPACWPRLHALFADIFARKPRDHWAAHFLDTDACVAPVLDLEEAPHHPHNLARGTFVAPQGVTQPAAAPRFAQSGDEKGPYKKDTKEKDPEGPAPDTQAPHAPNATAPAQEPHRLACADLHTLWRSA